MILSEKTWERIRAEFEVRGRRVADLAHEYGLNESTIRGRIERNGWQRGKFKDLKDRAVANAKEASLIEIETAKLKESDRFCIEKIAEAELEKEGLRVHFTKLLYDKGIELIANVTSASEWRVLTEGARNLMPINKQNNINVNSNVQVEQTKEKVISPYDAMQELINQAKTLDAESKSVGENNATSTVITKNGISETGDEIHTKRKRGRPKKVSR